VSAFNKIPAGFCPKAAENGGYDHRGLTSLRLRRITSSPSQTLRRRIVRTTDAAVSARRLPSFAALFFTLRDSYG